MRVEGLREVQAALDGLTGRQRQNIERKAARAAMNAQKRDMQLAWRTLHVKEKTPGGAKRSIRRATAKALTVKVGSRASGVYGRLFLNYKKLKAGRARLAHLLEYSHRVGDTQTTTTPKQPTSINFRKRSGRYRDMYLRAVLAWVHSPKMTQKQARSFLS